MSFDNSQHVINLQAEGAITAFTIVKFGTVDNNVDVAGANEKPLGIGPDYSVIADEMLPVNIGGVTQVELGGTVSAGDLLKADASGFAVVVATTGTVNQLSVGSAVKDGVVGDIIPVNVDLQTIRPALS